jgi:polyisoprenoid-binding protein YceI
MRIVAAGIVCLVLAGAVDAGEWHVDKKAKDNKVTFTSEVVALTFEGTTDKVDGYIYWEGETLFEKKDQLFFEVELNSLDSGIGKRDRDMRNVLDTKKWPKAVFKGEVASHSAIDSSVTAYRVVAKGTFSIHGVDKKIEVPGTIVVGAEHSQLEADFVIKLDDYDIEAPSLAAFIKVSQEVPVHLSLRMKHVK